MSKNEITIKLPEGWELDDREQPRYPKAGEYRLIMLEDGSWAVRETDRFLATFGGIAQYIIRKVIKREVGKYYFFSDNESHVGSIKGCLGKLQQVNSGDRCPYITRGGIPWKHCWPVPKDKLGE